VASVARRFEDFCRKRLGAEGKARLWPVLAGSTVRQPPERRDWAKSQQVALPGGQAPP
jgi:hypothetical protein